MGIAKAKEHVAIRRGLDVRDAGIVADDFDIGGNATDSQRLIVFRQGSGRQIIDAKRGQRGQSNGESGQSNKPAEYHGHPENPFSGPARVMAHLPFLAK